MWIAAYIIFSAARGCRPILQEASISVWSPVLGLHIALWSIGLSQSNSRSYIHPRCVSLGEPNAQVYVAARCIAMTIALAWRWCLPEGSLPLVRLALGWLVAPPHGIASREWNLDNIPSSSGRIRQHYFMHLNIFSVLGLMCPQGPIPSLRFRMAYFYGDPWERMQISGQAMVLRP